MRKLVSLLGLCFGLPAIAATTDPVDASATARNPALAPVYTENAPGLASIGGQIYFDDSDDLTDMLLEAQNKGLELERQTRGLLLLPGQEQDLIDHLKAMDGRVTTTGGGVNAAYYLPVENHGLQLNFNFYGRGAGSFIYDPEDENTLRFAVVNALFSTDDLHSRVVVSGAILSDIGITYSQAMPGAGPLTLGATIKYQNINLLERIVQIDEYEEDKLFDRHRDLKQHSHVNLDIGANWQWQSVQLSASLLNLNARDFSTPNGRTYHLRPELKAQAGWYQGWGNLTLDLDVTPNHGFGVMDDLQLAKLRSQFHILERLSVGLGYHHVIQGQNSDAIEVALQYRLGELFLSAHGLLASANELGGGFQVQMPF